MAIVLACSEILTAFNYLWLFEKYIDFGQSVSLLSHWCFSSCADKSSYGITFTVEEHKDDSTSSEVYISPGKGGEKVPVGTPSSNESSDVATFDSDASIPM